MTLNIEQVLALIHEIYDDHRWPRYIDVYRAMNANHLEARRAVKILTEAGDIEHRDNGVLIPMRQSIQQAREHGS